MNGEKQSAALSKDEVRVAMLTQLELPKSYKADEIAKRKGADSSQSVPMRMVDAFKTVDKNVVARLQLNADRGMHAAQDLIASGSTIDKFLQANPSVAEALKKDAAFRAGFHGLVWTKANAPAEYKDAIKQLEGRDCWYSQSNVSIRL